MSAGADSVRRMPGAPSLRRDPVPDLREDFGVRTKNPGRRAADTDPFAEEAIPSRRAPVWKLKLRSRVPRSVVGKVAACVTVLSGFGVIGYGLHAAQTSLLHDARLTIPSSRAIEISGNQHLTRAQLLSVFGEDVDRNVLTVPLAGRRAELGALPWVEHATVMRLMPNRVRVAIVERTPVAFVRQGSEIGMVDAHGVLLDLAPDTDALQKYSFPVVTGIQSTDPVSVRVARMKLYEQFTNELDSGSEKISKKLSEVDLTDPDDVKALLMGESVLIHFGKNDFLARYQRFEQNLADWKAKYPKLASADMQYPREVVLEMAPGATVPVAEGDGSATPDPAVTKLLKKPVLKAKVPVAAKGKAKPLVFSHAKAVPVKPARGPR